MPSKYSHTVVLAQQSSRGLINLPNDQYVDYLRSSPLLTTKPPPQRPSTAPPKNRSRATTSTQTNGSERLAVQNGLRQHTSSDQLAAGAYRHQANHGRLYRPTRYAIVDSEEDDSGDYSDAESHSSRPSYTAYSTMSQTTNLREKRLPSTMPIELHQQLMHEGILSANSHNSQRVQKKPPQPTVYAEPDVRQSMELPIQMPTYSSVLPARGRISVARVHKRDVSNPKSLTTPQLSRTSTRMTHRDDSPATPFSSIQRGTTPAMTDEQTPNMGREDSALSQNNRNHTPEPTKMPLQANFDDFWDGSEQGLGYFKDLPESAEAKKARLVNMRAYNAMEKAIKDSPTSGAFGSEKNLPAVPYSDSALHPPAQNRYRSHLGSLSSLSSLSDFAIDAPFVSQTMGQRNISAASTKIAPPSAVCELETCAPQKQAKVSSSAKQIQLPPSRLPSQSRNKLPEFDPNLLDPTTISFSQFINSLEFRFSEPEPTFEAAVTPPDISRHPPAMLDPLAQLTVDPRGGVTSLAAQEQLQQREKQRQRAKSGIFSSLRLKGKNRRDELM